MLIRIRRRIVDAYLDDPWLWLLMGTLLISIAVFCVHLVRLINLAVEVWP